MADEIERKFVVTQLPGHFSVARHHEIEQGYLAIEERGNEVRLRRKDARFFLAVKSMGALLRNEVEVEIDASQFTPLFQRTSGRRVEKTRHEVVYGQHVIEVDVYKGPLEGLIVAEVEFSSLAEAMAFIPPSWLQEEVSHDTRYKNRNLAMFGMPRDP